MYDAVHTVKYVVLSETEATKLVEIENDRLKKRQDFDKSQKAYFESHEVYKLG